MAEYRLDTSLASELASTLSEFELAYITTAMWTLTDDDGSSMDYLGLHDIHADTITAARADCADFLAAAGSLLDGASLTQAGHDFWLTRNGHGAGFWDRAEDTYPNDPGGDQLTVMAKAAGSLDWYIGDDGMVY
jgi:hypothetical protein